MLRFTHAHDRHFTISLYDFAESPYPIRLYEHHPLNLMDFVQLGGVGQVELILRAMIYIS